MNFAKAAGAFTHSNAEVRDSAKVSTIYLNSVELNGEELLQFGQCPVLFRIHSLVA